jgi:hypothetical protein
LARAQQAFQDAKKITALSTVPDVTKGIISSEIMIDSVTTGTIGRFVTQGLPGTGGCLIFDVISVVDEQNVVLFSPNLKVGIWLEGYPTKELVDGQKVVIIDYVEATQTRSYTTALGARSTVWAFRLIDKDETSRRLNQDIAAHEKWEAELEKKLPKGMRQNRPDGELRIWNLKNRTTIEGKFKEIKNGSLKIVDRNGKETAIRSNLLSDTDRSLAISLQKEIENPKKGNDSGVEKADSPSKAKNKMAHENLGERSVWVNKSYKSKIVKITNSVWHEIMDEGKKLAWHYDLVDANDDYVELYLRERKQYMRIYADHADLKDGNDWKLVANGNWTNSRQ